MLNLTLMHLIVKIKRRCSGETSNGFYVSIIWETFCCQNTEERDFSYEIFLKEIAVFFLKLWLNHTVRCFHGLWCPLLTY